MKNRKEIIKKIKELLNDERIQYPLATVQENAPLAFVQVEIKTWVRALSWVLGGHKIPIKFHSQEKEKEKE